MVDFLAVTWDVNPVLVRIFGIDVMWYGLSWVAAIAIGMWFFGDFIRRERLNPEFENIFWWGAIATIVGARLGHCLFYDAWHYLTHPIELLYFRQGGMASHGAALGLLVGLWGFSRRSKLPYIWSLDRVMIPVAVGGAIVRLGNLINSEIYGHQTDLPWGFIFVREGETVPKHPTQIYEALCYLLTFAVLVWLYYKKDMASKRPGLIFGVGLIGIFLSRFLLEFIKNPQVAAEENMLLNIGQILSLPFIVAGVVMMIVPYTRWRTSLNANRWMGLSIYNPQKTKQK